MSIYDEIRAERERAHAKHGATSMEGNVPPEDPTGRRYRILVEEVGEVAEEWNDADHDGRPVDMARVRKELIQVAAMAVAWADAIPVGVADTTEADPVSETTRIGEDGREWVECETCHIRSPRYYVETHAEIHASPHVPSPEFSKPFRFGPEMPTGSVGGCCGIPTGCTISSRGCLHKVEKKAWQESVGRVADTTEADQ